MGVSKNSGTTKSSILIGFSIINHPFRGTPIFGNTHIVPHPKRSWKLVSFRQKRFLWATVPTWRPYFSESLIDLGHWSVSCSDLSRPRC